MCLTQQLTMSKDYPNHLTSPDFKRITGKLRVIKRRKRSKVVSDSVLPAKSDDCVTKEKAARSRNPFKSLPANATSSPAVTDDSVESDVFVPRTPDKVEPRLTDESGSFVVPYSSEESSSFRLKRRRLTSEDYILISNPTTKPSVTSSHSDVESTDSVRASDELLLDYSLYTKVRLTSTYDLCSLTQAADQVKSQATADFISGQSGDEGSVQQMFHKYIHYYMYPDLPWLSLFPRTSDNKTASLPLPQTAYSVLDTQWKSAFTAAYNGLVSNHLSCGYFYTLCEGFTVLFHRCAECETVSSVVSPTTRGFRQNLQARGIDFTLPLQPDTAEDKSSKQSKPSSTQDAASDQLHLNPSTIETEQHPSAEEDPNNSLVEGGEGDDPLDWLEDIGLEKSHFPSLRASKVQMEEEAFKSIDYRPASTALVVGEKSVDRLKEFIKEYSRTVASTGQLASIPPTIVSRSPFLGASIQKLEIRSGQMVSHAGGDKLSYIDLGRPILPGVVADIMSNVIGPKVPSEMPVNVSLVSVDDTQVYNVSKCSCTAECAVESTSSFVYKNSRFYYMK